MRSLQSFLAARPSAADSVPEASRAVTDFSFARLRSSTSDASMTAFTLYMNVLLHHFSTSFGDRILCAENVGMCDMSFSASALKSCVTDFSSGTSSLMSACVDFHVWSSPSSSMLVVASFGGDHSSSFDTVMPYR